MHSVDVDRCTNKAIWMHDQGSLVLRRPTPAVNFKAGSQMAVLQLSKKREATNNCCKCYTCNDTYMQFLFQSAQIKLYFDLKLYQARLSETVGRQDVACSSSEHPSHYHT